MDRTFENLSYIGDLMQSSDGMFEIIYSNVYGTVRAKISISPCFIVKKQK